MKKHLSILLFLMIIINSCDSNYKKINIEGKINSPNAVIKLMKDNTEISSSNVIDGSFQLNGMIPKKDFYDLKIFFNGSPSDSKVYIIFLDGGECTISFPKDRNNYYPTVQSNSEIQRHLTKFYNKYEERKKDIDLRTSMYNLKLDSLQKVDGELLEYNDAFKASSEAILQSEKLWTESIDVFISENPASVLSAYFMSDMEDQIEYDPVKYKLLYETFSEEVKNSKYGQVSQKIINKFNRGVAGTKLPDIFGEDIKGESLNMMSLKGKVSLIIFWQSSNNDSKRDMQVLLEKYEQYRPQGLEIVAVSFDSNKERWEKYINENNIPWKNLYDVEGISSPNVKNFGNTNIPYNFLVGPDLIISERNIPLDQFDLYFNTIKNKFMVKEL